VDWLSQKYMRLDVTANRPEEAIQQAGEVLLAADAVEPAYVEHMITNYHEHGPYFVLAPHIAMPHARPEDGVKRSALSLVRLRKAMPFGHELNDPVQLIIGLAAASSDDHLRLLRKMALLLRTKNVRKQLLAVDSIAEMEAIVKENQQ
jgi:ascorbate PTS system EIIA or EIIAB component